MDSIDRRTFLSRGARAGAATIASGPLTGLLARAAGAAPGRRALRSQATRKDGGYGPLLNRGDLWLPEGFRYVAFGQAGTPLPLTRGGAPAGTLPRGHDGMASFAAGPGVVRIVGNHGNRTEVSPLGGAGYDSARLGGTTTMEFDVGEPADASKDGSRFRPQWASLRGTSTNCGCGLTRWGSWLTCEETVESVAGIPHGYVFEVPSRANGPVRAEPLKAMGRFVHEGSPSTPARASSTRRRTAAGRATGPVPASTGSRPAGRAVRHRRSPRDARRHRAAGLPHVVPVSVPARCCRSRGCRSPTPIPPARRRTARRSSARVGRRAARCSTGWRARGGAAAACSSSPPTAATPTLPATRAWARSGSTRRAVAAAACSSSSSSRATRP